jgi:hypothetical protein
MPQFVSKRQWQSILLNMELMPTLQTRKELPHLSSVLLTGHGCGVHPLELAHEGLFLHLLTGHQSRLGSRIPQANSCSHEQWLCKNQKPQTVFAVCLPSTFVDPHTLFLSTLMTCNSYWYYNLKWSLGDFDAFLV